MLTNKLQGYLEALALSFFMLIFGFLTKPDNPLHIGEAFPWVWFFPVLVVLRYGWLPGFIPLLFILFTMGYSMYFLAMEWSDYQLWLLGGVTLTLICGEFQSVWYKRQVGIEEKVKYTDAGLQFLSRSYGVLKLSHDRLEESLINAPTTMRQALGEVRKILVASKGSLTNESANFYLELFATEAFLEIASIYLYENKKWDLNPIAFLGKDSLPLIMKDALVQKCFTKKETVYTSVNVLQDGEKSSYVAVVPMITSDNDIIGLLTITRMQFFMLNDPTLEKLTLLLAYVADEIAATKNAVDIQKCYPDCPSLFASELSKLRYIWDLVKIDSRVFGMYIKPSPLRDTAIYLIKEQMRGLDVFWLTEVNDIKIVIIIFPLMTKSMYEGYITRIDNLFYKELHIYLMDDPLYVKNRGISEYKNNDALLADFVKYDNR